MSAVGPKGQVVIEKSIRDRLGIAPGWRAIQTLDGDRVEIRFVPPDHHRSLFGVLSEYANCQEPTDEELNQAVEQGIAAEFQSTERDRK